VIEERQGSLTLLILVLALAMVSNLVQYFVAGGGFAGMSGVVYGLLSYIALRGKLDRRCGLFFAALDGGDDGHLVLCMSRRILGSAIITAHIVGLVMGTIWGFFSSLRHR